MPCSRAAPAALDRLKPRTLFTEEFCLTVSAGHPLHDPGSVSLSKLKREQFILYKNPGHNRRELTIQCCRNAGFEPDVAFESEQAETIHYLFASNLGVTLRYCGITSFSALRWRGSVLRRRAGQ